MEGQEAGKVGAMVMAMADVEIEAQAKLARQYPRKMALCLENALGELELDAKLAGKAYYSIPYKQWNKEKKVEETVFVEGPSIKAAMSLAGHWGNCANGARVVAQDDERIVVEGVFIDYERNVRWVRQQVVSRKRYDTKSAQMVPLREDRVVMAVQAGSSKAVRNAVLAGIPVAIVEKYMDKAKALASGVGSGKKLSAKDLKDRLAKMTEAFGKLGVSSEQLASYMKTNIASLKTNEEKMAHMVGVFNSIEDGLADASEVFGIPAATDTQATRATGAGGSVKMDDLLKKKDAEKVPAPKEAEKPTAGEPDSVEEAGPSLWPE